MRWRSIKLFLALAVAVFSTACSDLYCDPDTSISCDDDECTPAPTICARSAPSQGYLLIEVSDPRPVVVKVYRGATVEAGVLIYDQIPPAGSWILNLPNNAYSATALYVKNGDSVLVFDGDEVRTSALETCEGTCFNPGNVTLDLTLSE